MSNMSPEETNNLEELQNTANQMLALGGLAGAATGLGYGAYKIAPLILDKMVEAEMLKRKMNDKKLPKFYEKIENKYKPSEGKIMFYHGTNRKFDPPQFNYNKYKFTGEGNNAYGAGSYVTKDLEHATDFYARNAMEASKKRPYVIVGEMPDLPVKTVSEAFNVKKPYETPVYITEVARTNYPVNPEDLSVYNVKGKLHNRRNYVIFDDNILKILGQEQAPLKYETGPLWPLNKISPDPNKRLTYYREIRGKYLPEDLLADKIEHENFYRRGRAERRGLSLDNPDIYYRPVYELKEVSPELYTQIQSYYRKYPEEYDKVIEKNVKKYLQQKKRYDNYLKTLKSIEESISPRKTNPRRTRQIYLRRRRMANTYTNDEMLNMIKQNVRLFEDPRNAVKNMRDMWLRFDVGPTVSFEKELVEHAKKGMNRLREIGQIKNLAKNLGTNTGIIGLGIIGGIVNDQIPPSWTDLYMTPAINNITDDGPPLYSSEWFDMMKEAGAETDYNKIEKIKEKYERKYQERKQQEKDKEIITRLNMMKQAPRNQFGFYVQEPSSTYVKLPFIKQK